MIKNYIKTAWRNLLRSKAYSLVAILGLAIGLAVSILLFWGVNDELSYDTQSKDAENIYRVNAKGRTGDHYETWTTTPAPVGLAAVKNYPDVKRMARTTGGGVLVNVGTFSLYQDHVAYTEPSFFDIFDIHFIEGNAKTAISEVNYVALSNTLAIKFFGSAKKAMGKIMSIREKQLPYVVSAVYEDMPLRSSVHKNMILSLDNIRKNFGGNGSWKTIDEDWGNYNFTTFLQLKPGTNTKVLADNLASIMIKSNPAAKKGEASFILQPLSMLRLYSPDLSPDGVKTVRIFILIGVLILLIAVINYINLSTARATKRAKEVGLRRVVGADRMQLIMQFVAEFVIIFLASIVLAFILIGALVPVYQNISGKDYPIDYWQPSTLKIILWVGIGTIVMASIYPAWVLSSFKPTEVLKATFNAPAKGGWLRKTLVVVQFTFSITLIICTVVIAKQLYFIQHTNLGYNRDNTFTVWLNDNMGKHLSAVMNDIKSDSHIVDVSYGDQDFMSMSGLTDNIDWPGKTDHTAHITNMDISANFTSMMGIKFADGSGFTGAPSDSSYYLVNEAAIKMMGLKHPVGTIISLWGKPKQIKGVLHDFNNTSLKGQIMPAIFRIASQPITNGALYVKVRSAYAKESIEKMEQLYRAYAPGHPFSYQFLDDAFDDMYRREIQTTQLFKAFAGVTILLSCMGLFGLAVFSAERRVKEIGIRKVLGASVRDISVLVSGEFTTLIIIANIIAWPIAWYFTHQWLQDFSYRTSVSWWLFLLCGLVSLTIAIITVSSQAIKAAMVNPVKSLKAE
ncbi:FtsX-like permease family protein [Mucilaginibacter corticis]|uniref:FtsX-like permease family protein n=1 Tax=Mucilaginibacter corticis TaxID=2597670 RepID=A0A556MUF4_9SPHI|nr:FtsX-like permease family protein [Mucilaginibacter corticis]TSJ43581.1 FtsX-like permease family protein [Mucilaginibacter corticis]